MMVARNKHVGHFHRWHDFTTTCQETQSGLQADTFRGVAAPVVRENRKFGQAGRVDLVRVGHRVDHSRLVRAAENGREMDPTYDRVQDRRPTGRHRHLAECDPAGGCEQADEQSQSQQDSESSLVHSESS
jgi:hypothetical protein